MSVGPDNKNYILCKYSSQKVSTVVDKNIITDKQRNKLKGGDAIFIG